MRSFLTRLRLGSVCLTSLRKGRERFGFRLEQLEAHDLWANKGLGQHFLLDLNITSRIAKTAGDLAGKHVIEVGPGPGGLTRALLEAGAHVTALEKDARFLPLLEPLKNGKLAPVNAKEPGPVKAGEKVTTRPEHGE